MYVTETAGHKVAPTPTARAKMVEYKGANEHGGERGGAGGGGGGGGGGGTHLAATVKNTVRRLLRRTKSHREGPATNANSITPTTNGNRANNQATIRNKPNNANDQTARRSQPPLPPSFEQQSSRNSYAKRHQAKPRVKLQKSRRQPARRR